MWRLDTACLPALRPEMSWNDSVSWALLTFSKTLPEKRTSSIGRPSGTHGQRCGVSGRAEASIRMRFNHRLWRLHPLVNSGTSTGDPGWRDDPTQNDLLHTIHVVARHVARQGIPQDAT